jgi:hypothetical protein
MVYDHPSWRRNISAGDDFFTDKEFALFFLVQQNLSKLKNLDNAKEVLKMKYFRVVIDYVLMFK